MRLTVVVAALAEENAHGEYRDLALAAFKERRFAMPVELDDTLDKVWGAIEQRYKTNYLDSQQAATFGIKKLQDAYDCDLDMTDTVADIFEGEPDVRMRLIKVIPRFTYRETSVVPGSMLRPMGAHKRGGVDLEDGGHKRRRVASQQRQSSYDAHDAHDLSPNRPIPSTESRPAATPVAEDAGDAEAGRRLSRLGTAVSVVEVRGGETGQAPFRAPSVKQEALAPEQLPLPNGTDAASPVAANQTLVEPTTQDQPRDERPPQTQTRTPREQSQDALLQPVGEELLDATEERTEDEPAAAQGPAEPLQPDSHEAAVQQSPVSSIELEVEPELEPAEATGQRKDIYQVSSSPDFMHKRATPDKPGRTYARSPKTGSNLLNVAQGYRPGVESEADPNTDLATPSSNDAAAAASATPQTPARSTTAKPVRPGSLKKPSRSSLLSTPGSAKRGANSKTSATHPLAASASQPRPVIRPSPAQSTPRKSATQPPPGSRQQTLLSSAASQRAIGTPKGKQAALVAKRVPITPAPNSTSTLNSTQDPTGTPQGKSYGCPNCEARFSREDNLRRHAKKHFIERTHTCFKCGSQFYRADELSRHINRRDCCASQDRFESEGTGRHSAGTISDANNPEASQSHSLRKPRNKITSFFSEGTKPMLRQSGISSLPTGHHSRCNSSSFATGHPGPSNSAPAVPVKKSAEPKIGTPISSSKFNGGSARQSNAATSTADPPNGTIDISSVEPFSSGSSDSSDSDHETGPQPEAGDRNALVTQDKPAETSLQPVVGEGGGPENEVTRPQRTLPEPLGQTQDTEPQTQDKPPSGQEANGAARWGTQSWGFGGLDQKPKATAEPKPVQEPLPEPGVVTPVTEDEGFVENTYSSAAEDDAVGSRSASPAASTRSSPAVSRRPARFLSHSPTPDASESDEDVDEATAVKVASPQVDHKEGSQSESESSSDSSDDEDAELPHLSSRPSINVDPRAEPPSSPPLGGLANLTPVAPNGSQSTPSKARQPVSRTPIPPPTLQSSQAPRSSQSVSVQAVDRRRYTGFRSLREQLADTKAAQATSQKKAFDPRTVSLDKLVKGTPLAGLGDDGESSDDESSSSSDSD